MLVTGLFIAFLAVVSALSWRFRNSEAGPKSCCSNRPWPPDDLTGEPSR
jgi:hypothetical protein